MCWGGCREELKLYIHRWCMELTAKPKYPPRVWGKLFNGSSVQFYIFFGGNMSDSNCVLLYKHICWELLLMYQCPEVHLACNPRDKMNRILFADWGIKWLPLLQNSSCIKSDVFSSRRCLNTLLFFFYYFKKEKRNGGNWKLRLKITLLVTLIPCLLIYVFGVCDSFFTGGFLAPE